MALIHINISRKGITYASAHVHKFYEIILNMEGSGTIYIGDRAFPFEAGSIHIIPPNTPHIKCSDAGFQDVYFQTAVLYPRVKQMLKQQKYCLQDDPQKTIELVMTLLFSKYWSNAASESVLCTMYELLLQLLDDSVENELLAPEVETIIHKMTMYFNDPDFSVADTLRQSGYSKDHIRRMFIAATQISPQEYLTNIRIAHAKKLLEQNNSNQLSVADIGAMSGYYDAKYFSRIFKKVTGVSPTQYLEGIKENTV